MNNTRSFLFRRVPEAGDHCGDGRQRWQGEDTLHWFKENGGPSAGIAVGLNATYVHREFAHQTITPDLAGPGVETSVGYGAASVAHGQNTDSRGNVLPNSLGGYDSWGGAIHGKSLDVGVFNWRTTTVVVPINY